MVDKVYEDTIRGNQSSKNLGDEMVETNMNAMVSKIDTRTQGIPVVVFNTLGWARSDFVEVDVGFSEPGATVVELFGPSAEAVPLQYINAERYSNGGLKHAKIAFISRDVPALGYCLYQIIPRGGGSAREEGIAVSSGPAQHYRP